MAKCVVEERGKDLESRERSNLKALRPVAKPARFLVMLCKHFCVQRPQKQWICKEINNSNRSKFALALLKSGWLRNWLRDIREIRAYTKEDKEIKSRIYGVLVATTGCHCALRWRIFGINSIKSWHTAETGRIKIYAMCISFLQYLFSRHLDNREVQIWLPTPLPLP